MYNSPRMAWLFSFFAFTAFIMATAFGQILMAAFYGSCVLFMMAYPRRFLETLSHPVAWLVPLLALVSVFWSREPSLSMKLGTEFLITVVCGILLARVQSKQSFLSSLMCALLVASVASVVFGHEETISYTGQEADRGIFGSKNFFAYLIATGILTAMAVVVDNAQPKLMRRLATVGVLINAVLLLKARSIGAIAATGVAVMPFALIALMSKLPMRWRGVFLTGPLVVGVGVGAVLAFILSTDGVNSLLHMVGKSSDLTGRSYMWIRAAEYIREHPLLGLGYQAFWVQGYVEAEGMWQYMHIDARAGVHFHNMFYETAVELGYLGVAVLFGTLALVTLRFFKQAVYNPSPTSAYFLAFMIYSLSRVYLEVDFLFPFTYGSLILGSLVVFSEEPVRAPRAVARPMLGAGAYGAVAR